MTRARHNEKPSRFAALMDAAVDAIIVIDAKGLIQEFNPAAERMFGYQNEEIIGQNVKLLMPQPYSGEHDQYLERYNETGEGHIIGIGREVMGKHKLKGEFAIDLSVGEVRETDQVFFVGIIRDISDRKAAEETLRRQEETLRQILDYAPSGILTCDQSGLILTSNKTLNRILEFASGTLDGCYVTDIVHPNNQETLRRNIQALFNQDYNEFTLELSLQRSNGHEVPCRFLASVVHTADRRPQHVIVQMEDLSQQLIAQQEAQLYRERLTHVTRLSTLGEMTTGIAHEINQPLTAIVTYSQAAKRLQQRGATEEMAATLTKIAQQAERAANVVQNLRNFVRRQPSEHRFLRCDELVSGVIQFLELDSGRRNIAIDTQVPVDLPQVLGDPVQIQQVLVNLLLNAMDATSTVSSHKSVLLSCRLQEDYVIFSVKDWGCGVDPAQEHQLFSAFHTTKAMGMGMGLAICRTIIQAHGGEMSYAPNPEGGSIFRFTLSALNQV